MNKVSLLILSMFYFHVFLGGGKSAAFIVKQCQEQGLFLRDASGVGSAMGNHAIRIAVKDQETNQRMLGILNEVLNNPAKGDKG